MMELDKTLDKKYFK